jgi:pimeloyl-ACP methyl ester carboxylesterase
MFNWPSLWLADVIAHHAPMLVGWATIEIESSLEEDDVIKLMRDIMKDEQRVKIIIDLIRGMSPSSLRIKGLNNDIKQLAKIDGLPFEQITAPTLVIHGTNDLDFPLEHAQAAAGKISGAEIYLVEGGFPILALSDDAETVRGKKIMFLRIHAPQ